MGTRRAFSLFGPATPQPWRVLVIASNLGWLVGCGGGDDDDSEASTVRVLDENNYTSQSALTLPNVDTAAGTDLDICWDDLMSDIQCHDLSPQEEIDVVSVVRFKNNTQAEVEEKLATSELAQSDTSGYLDYLTDHDSTCTKLSSLNFLGTDRNVIEEYVESDVDTYLLLFATSTREEGERPHPGVGARAMTFITPRAESTNTEISAPPGCGMLEFSAQLASREPVSIPEDGPWDINWRDITVDSNGNPISFQFIDRVMLGFYADRSVENLEEEILDIEINATAIWEMKIDGTKEANLAAAVKRDTDQVFKGFDQDEDGTWLFGLLCSTCRNPAPLVLSVLEPTEGE